uniref:Centrosomal protein of 19 kDa n=1 Tax=Euplotes crassus TaxID=5936 RepID=A0A7S3NQP3_EUPCR|mmetsp:Transcript_1117/g.1098  ORF Transcript_1117/g.1098 Transcript_1117/m.1098 type:complete len:275 (+) Transcript_1117:19-843(+)
MEGGSKRGKIIPTNFGLKYNPPKLGIQYYFKENPKATFVHEVKLENVQRRNSGDLLEELFTKHPKFVDPNVVSRNQLENLMERLKSHLSHNSPLKNKENFHENTNKSSEADDWGLDINSAQKDEQLVKPQELDKDIFSSDNKGDFKNNDKNFMLDDFEMDKEDGKINPGNDMFDGFVDDLSEPKSKLQDTPTENDGPQSDLHADENEDEEDSDAIDIDNEEELAARGLKKIQIEGEEEEFLMDGEGNIYNLNGDFIGTTNGDGEEDGDADEGEF